MPRLAQNTNPLGNKGGVGVGVGAIGVEGDMIDRFRACRKKTFF